MLFIKLCIPAVLFLMGVSLNSQNVKSGDDDVIEYSRYSDQVAISIISAEAADSIYDFISNLLEFIEFDECNNCDSRAHFITSIVEKKFSLTLAKAWLFADLKRSSLTEKYKLKPHVYLSDKDDCTKWVFHVAPLVIIKRDGIQDTLILDPSTADSAISLRRWALNIIQSSKGGTGFLIIKDADYYTYPGDKNGKFEDERNIWADNRSKELFDGDYSKSINAILKARYGILEVNKINDFENKIRQMLR